MNESPREPLPQWLTSSLTIFFTSLLTPIIDSAVQKASEELQAKQLQKAFLTIDEVTREFNVSKPTIHGWFSRGLIDRIKIPGSKKTYINRSQLTEALKIIRPYQRSL